MRALEEIEICWFPRKRMMKVNGPGNGLTPPDGTCRTGKGFGAGQFATPTESRARRRRKEINSAPAHHITSPALHWLRPSALSSGVWLLGVGFSAVPSWPSKQARKLERVKGCFRRVAELEPACPVERELHPRSSTTDGSSGSSQKRSPVGWSVRKALHNLQSWG